jgi:hypothetical protein
VRVSSTNLCASAAAAIAALAMTACGSGRADSVASHGPYTVQVVRASFAARQHIGQRSTVVITVRNTGTTTISDLTVTLGGFTQRTRDGIDRPLWIVDAPPRGTVTAIDDTWAAGALAPGRQATLRWSVTAAVAGTHELRYAIAPAVGGGESATLAGGGPARGTLPARVSARPAQARVDPRTGAVIRRE